MALSDEDKRWITEQLDGFGVGLRSETYERLEAMETKLLTASHQLDVLRSENYERLEAMETKLLTAFHQWASPVDTRLRAHAAALHALDVEQQALRDRLDKLDGGPPTI